MKSILLRQENINGRYQRMRLEAPEIAQTYRPGQFVMIGLGDPAGAGEAASYDPLLRRPFSLYDLDPQAGWIDILYKVQGRGTALMAGWGAGQPVDCAGPFGNGFRLDPAPTHWWIVGGGVGIPPLLTVADALARRENPPRISMLFGGRSAVDLYYREIQGTQISLATEDGSTGLRGRVTNLLAEAFQPEDAPNTLIAACGPNAMMKAVWKWASQQNIACQVSLENRMACALGVCLGCVVPATAGGKKKYPRVCTEGPVFDAPTLDWDNPDWPV